MATRPSANLLIPPRSIEPRPGRFSLRRRLTLSAMRAEDAPALRRLAAALTAAGSDAVITDGFDAGAAIVVRRDPAIAAEGYRLTLGPTSIAVAASDAAGAQYALSTLREMLAAQPGRASLPCQLIDDAPAFARRGIMLDCARGKVPTLATLMRLAEQLADWKLNELQLYVENAFAFAAHPELGRGWSPLTPAEICSLQDHCRGLNVRLVGTLATFGHMEKMLALPQYAPLGELPNGATLCPTDPRSIALVEELLDEYVPLFEAVDFNACCDETWDLTSGRGRSGPAIARHGAGKVYVDFVRKLGRLCGRHGKRMNVWADILMHNPEQLSRLPKDIVLLHWAYEAKSDFIDRTGELADAGLSFAVCPGTSGWNTLGGRWSNAAGNIRHFTAGGAAHGAEGQINTDWGDNGHRQFLAISLMPMALGAAEAWNPGAADVGGFPRTFARQMFCSTDGRLGDAIAALGSVSDRHGWHKDNQDPLALSIAEPVVAPSNAQGYHANRTLDRFSPEALSNVLQSLPPASIWQQPTGDSFAATALAEFALTAEMIELYCLRSSIAWEVGLGREVSSSVLSGGADRFDAMNARFEALWRAGNKPSRVADNVRLFRQVSAELRRLARRGTSPR